MSTSLISRQFKAGGFVEAGSMTPEVVVHHPEEVRKITREFKEAGAEVLQTLTFFGTANMLARAGLTEKEVSTLRGVIRYVITQTGPEPVLPGQPLPAGIDRRHYREKVLRPVADAILPEIGHSFDEALGQPRQLSLL